MDVQTVSKDYIHTVGQTPVGTPLSETVTTVQPIRVYSNHQNNLLVTSPNASNLAPSFKKFEKKKAGVLTEVEMTKSIPCAERDVKQEPHLETEPDPEKHTVAEVWTDVLNTEPNNRIADAEKGFNTASASPGIPPNNHNPESENASIEILKVEVEVKSNNETVIVAADVSGFQESNKVKVDSPEPAETPEYLKIYHRSNNSDTYVSPVEAKTLSDDNSIEKKEKDREDECILLVSSLVLSTSTTDESNSKPNKVMDHPETASNTANASSGGLDSSDNIESKTTSMETYKTEATGVSEAKAHPSDEDNESGGREDQEAPKLSISSLEECLSPKEVDELMHPTNEVKCFSPEICSPTKTEVFLSMTDHVFCPVDPEDLLVSQNQTKKVLSLSEPDTYLSPAEVTEYLSPNGEEESEEACLSLTEANAHIKPVEKYILSTKEEEGRSLSFSGDQGLAEEDRYTNITGSSRDKGKDSRSMADDVKKNDSQVVNKPVDIHRELGKPASSRCSNDKAALNSAAEKNSPCNRKEESSSDDSKLATSPPGTGRFKRRGSEEWMVYGILGRKHNLNGSDSLPETESKGYQLTDRISTTSPPTSGRIGSEGSREWRVYGRSSEHLSSAGSTEQVSGTRSRAFSPPGNYTSSRPRICSTGSVGKLNPGSVVRRSSSVGSGGRLGSSGSGGRLSSSPGSYRISSTGSGEWKPVYSSASGRRSSVGSTGQHGGGRKTSSQRAPSPGVMTGVRRGSGEWLSSSAAAGNRVSGAGSNDRISNRAGGRISSSSGLGRTSSTGGRVISSSDGPVRSTGSEVGKNKERISVCKMAALSISAAGGERSQERQRSQHQQAAGENFTFTTKNRKR